MQALPGGKLPLGRHNQDPNRPRPINRVWVIKTDSWNDPVRQCKVPSDCSDSLNLCTEQLAPLIKSSDSVYLESTAFESIFMNSSDCKMKRGLRSTFGGRAYLPCINFICNSVLKGYVQR